MPPTSNKRLVVASVMAVIIVCATAAPSQAADDERWYGWQMLPSDLAAWALIGGGYALKAESGGAVLAYLGVIAATLGGPIVHFANGRGGVGMASLGLRGGAIVLAALSLVFSEDPHDPGGERAAKAAVVVGAAALIAGQLIDLVVIARQRQDDAAAPGQRMLRLGFTF